MNIAIGSDPNALRMKQVLINKIENLGYAYDDFGSEDTIYANVAIEVASVVSNGTYDRGVLLCGTGIGVSISANKVRGAYAALVSNAYTAEKAITSNKSNILCMGALVLGDALAEYLLEIWLNTEYIPGTASEEKVKRYVKYDSGRQDDDGNEHSIF